DICALIYLCINDNRQSGVGGQSAAEKVSTKAANRGGDGSMARRRTMTDEVYDELRRQIVDVELLPGSVLPERAICEHFGISRTPLREAVLRLVQSGLVVVAPQYATFVSPLDVGAIREAHFLRENLEPAALRLLCTSDNINLSSMEKVLLEQKLLLARGDLSSFLPLDDQFHRLIFQLAGLEGVWSIIHTKKAH